MFNSLILDVAIGLVFVYFILSLLCSVLIEAIASLSKWRPQMLIQGITELIKSDVEKYLDPATKEPIFLDKLKKNPLFLGEKPSYISSRSFIMSLLSSLKDHPGITADNRATAQECSLDSVKNIKKLAETLPADSNIRNTLVPLLDAAQGNLDKAMESMEKWYDEAMQRVTGWYKRKSQVFALGLAIVVALGLNADTFQISQTLYSDQTVREALVKSAQDLVKKEATPPEVKPPGTTAPGATTPEAAAPGTAPPGATTECAPTPEAGSPQPGQKSDLADKTKILKEAFKIDMPLGWSPKDLKWDPWNNFVKLVGILLTALMVTLGSNFWFELLNRLINLRNSGKKPLTVEEEKLKT